MDLAGFPVRILIQFAFDKQQKSITDCFSGALGNKIVGHKKRRENRNLLLLRQTLSDKKNHTVQQQQEKKNKKYSKHFAKAMRFVFGGNWIG